jgi:hypothetical protein
VESFRGPIRTFSFEGEALMKTRFVALLGVALLALTLAGSAEAATKGKHRKARMHRTSAAAVTAVKATDAAGCDMSSCGNPGACTMASRMTASAAVAKAPASAQACPVSDPSACPASCPRDRAAATTAVAANNR